MENIDITQLVGSISSWDTWIILIIVAISGMVGGLAHKLTSPPEDKTPLLGYVVVGAVSSLAILFVFTPSDAVRLIALSLAAGYGGKAILNALEAKLKTALAQAETAKAKENGQMAVETGKEAIRSAQGLHGALMKARQQSLETALESLKTTLPEFDIQSPENFSDKLKRLESRLNLLEELFQK